jgi:TRAP-type mannitol/chloroaromatic compound transport system substrate-binding protein
MKPLSKIHQEAVLRAKTEQEKIKAAANAMIETPMDMIRAILLKHEQAVIEVMRELAKERDRARELLERCENEMRYAGWTKLESDNPARNGVYEDVKEFLK